MKRGAAADAVEERNFPGPRKNAPNMLPFGARLDLAALASAVGKKVVDVAAFDDSESAMGRQLNPPIGCVSVPQRHDIMI